MNPVDITNRYFDAIKSRDVDSLAQLYADDATFTLPNGKQFVGAANIREMHLSVFTAGAPVPTPVSMVVGQNSIAVEIQARLADGSVRRTANFYQLNAEGRIQHLRVYMQGG